MLEMSLKTALGKQNEVTYQIFRIKKHLGEMEELANKNRTEISKIYNEVRQKLVERESFLKKQISETLEKEQYNFKIKIA